MFKNYLKIALKVFRRRKFFTFISLFAISFTLIVLMVAVAFLDHIFGAQAPETRLDRTLGIFMVELRNNEGTSSWNSPPGYKFLDRYVRGIPHVEKMSIVTEADLVSSYHGGEKIQSYLKRTDGAFWEIMEFSFLEGGAYTEDDEKNANFVAVINETTRKKFFGGDPAEGKMIEVDGQRFRVVGVVKDVPFLKQVPFADVWTPLSTSKTNTYRDNFLGNFNGILLAGSAADFPAIKADYQMRLKDAELPQPERWQQIFSHAETYFEHTTRNLTNSRGRETSQPNKSVAIIIIAMILFMLLPTINLVNINISRIMERASEIGVRKAFGASSWTLVGQFVTENVLLTLIGGALGFIFSRLVLRAITLSGWIPYADFRLNYRLFLYGLALAVFFGLMSGVYPAWKMSRLNPVEALKGSMGGGVR